MPTLEEVRRRFGSPKTPNTSTLDQEPLAEFPQDFDLRMGTDSWKINKEGSLVRVEVCCRNCGHTNIWEATDYDFPLSKPGQPWVKEFECASCEMRQIARLMGWSKAR